MSYVCRIPSMALALALASAAALAGEPGFVEEFNAGLAGWSGGANEQVLTSGGLTGDTDPYMLVSSSSFGQVATRNLNPPYSGNLTADGVTGVSMYLRDLGGSESVHVHVLVGTQLNFWISIASFTPSADGWGYFEVDFTDPSGWVRYRGSDSFENALAGADRMMLRHEPQGGDIIPSDNTIDFAVDRFTILPAGPEPCSAADLDEPYGQLDFSDVVAFLGAFAAMGPEADLAAPTGQWDFSDIVAFLGLFGAGCP